MSDNILVRIDEGQANILRILERVHADIQVIKHDFEEFRNLGQNRTISLTFKPTAHDSVLKNEESHDESTRRK